MNVALGDHQVTNFQSDVEARTIGASTHTPILDQGRWPDYDILWNVPAITTYPFDGSAVVYGDIGPVRPNPPPRIRSECRRLRSPTRRTATARTPTAHRVELRWRCS